MTGSLPNNEVPQEDEVSREEEDDRRRGLIFWWWIFFAMVLLIVIVVLAFLTGGGDDDGGDELVDVATPTAAPTTVAIPSTSVTTSSPAETTTSADPQTIDGVWTMNVDVTVATGACSGEEDEKVTPDTVTVRQDGDTFTIVGLGFPKDEQVWHGRIDGNLITFAGERIEDDGKTTLSFTLEVDFETSTMTGHEDWNWEGAGGTCAESESSVTATRVGD